MSGGKDLRLIQDNVFDLVVNLIEGDGWNDANRYNQPVQVVTSPIDRDQEVVPNIISVVTEDIRHSDVEIGSNLTNQTITLVIDIIAESQAVGLHLAGDITSLFQRLYNIPITDRKATPTTLFHCDIEGVYQERNRFYDSKAKEFWWVISFNIVHTEFAEVL